MLIQNAKSSRDPENHDHSRERADMVIAGRHGYEPSLGMLYQGPYLS